MILFKHAIIFEQTSQSILTKCSMLPQSASFSKFMLDLLRTIDMQSRELCLRDFTNYTFTFDLRPGTYFILRLRSRPC